MRPTPHILVINGTKVRRPVFVLGAPHSGTDLLARAVKQAAGFHLTAGRPGVLRVTYAFARRPAIASERGRGAARVLRDAYAEAWQISPRGCAQCPAECRALAGLPPTGAPDAPDAGLACAQPHGVHRFADASPDLIYSADVLLDAFPDAQLLQVIRDGRDVVAGMLADERCLAWFKPGFANLEEVFPNPFLGVEDFIDRNRWPTAAPAVKCALRWRGSVRLSARLRAQVPEDQLFTVRYEDLVARPGAVAEDVSQYLGAPLSKAALTGLVRAGDRGAQEGAVGAWRERLTPKQLAQVERVAGQELRRLGYRLSGAG
ncbi:Sulfotransferase family protein [Thermomonospora echinospora]|uniref:Sulfotransferase family protein n=1 Tax=Thermomonospora echinospora TaxID=1992 RepID=A0A1H6BY06_9ACTN|nr:sulfotransferase [Thermomonospora echinospora]SEG65533.1 Sulfotransferase family protein [Thermomonospora echinospora]